MSYQKLLALLYEEYMFVFSFSFPVALRTETLYYKNYNEFILNLL